MERGKRSETINGEIQLPEAIIQQIQSLLNGKEAAQTSVLSKSWYNAWLTSPNLDFDERNFEKRRIGDSESETAERFPNFVKKTMQRYEKLNLKIVKFKLWMEITEPGLVSLANESIMKALKMGVNDLNLKFPSSFTYPDEMYILPHEVLEAKTLIKLSAIGCRIVWPLDRKVLCSRLESLSLREVCVSDDVVWDIILRATSALKAWESDISMSCFEDHVKASWFHQLKRFLTKLDLSNISLSLWFSGQLSIDHVGEIEGLPRPVLENLHVGEIEGLQSCFFFAFLDGLFWSCRPKAITIYAFPRSCLLEILCKRIIEQVIENCYILNQNGQCGVKEANVESFEMTLKEWRSLTWKDFLDSLKVEEYKLCRFRLQWGTC